MGDSSTCSGTEPLRISGIWFYGPVFRLQEPPNHQCQSTEGNAKESNNSNHGLTSSFLHLLPYISQKGNQSVYAGSLMPFARFTSMSSYCSLPMSIIGIVGKTELYSDRMRISTALYFSVPRSVGIFAASSFAAICNVIIGLLCVVRSPISSRLPVRI